MGKFGVGGFGVGRPGVRRLGARGFGGVGPNAGSCDQRDQEAPKAGQGFGGKLHEKICKVSVIPTWTCFESCPSMRPIIPTCPK